MSAGCARLAALCLYALAAWPFGARAGALPAVDEAATPPQVIGAPHYGDTLFNFYQGRTFDALTSLIVSQHFGRLAPHDDQAEVLRGGMLLAYGLHREAGAVFARLIEGQASPAVRNRAWYFLALMQHRRNLPGDAQASLARISAPLGGGLEDERVLLRAELSMEHGDYEGAAKVLQALRGDTAAGLYARFNLGVAWIKSGGAQNLERGRAMLEAVGQAPAADEELRSLRDRANVALGFAALQAQQPSQARLALQRVRLHGVLSNKALLGFGWAAASLNDPQLALVPWTELAQRPEGDAAVLEARIAVPYALAELGAQARALRGYEEAASSFDAERKAMDESIAAVRKGQLVRGLLQANPSSGLAASTGIRTLPQRADDPLLPHAAHLAPVLATHGFQEAFKSLRDLQFLSENLQQWQDRLGTYGDMLATRRRAFEERLPDVRAKAGANDFEALQHRRDAIAAELARAEGAGDDVAFANARERELLQRMGRALGTLARIGSEAELGDAGERLRRVAGALTWERTRALPERTWEARKALRATDAALAQARARDTALREAQRDEPARLAAFAQRVAALTQRLAVLSPAVTQLAREQQGQLEDIAVAELQAQQQGLDEYAAQARLAIAQIHDRAQFARRGDAEAPR